MQALQNQVREFVKERNWRKFHSPRNLAAAISVEAAELLDIFKWSTSQDSAPENAAAIKDEVADVIIYCLSLCNRVDIDAAEAVEAKIAKNAEKYPVERYKGRWQ